MGANPSTTKGSLHSDQSTAEKKTCYYELLGVSRTATDDEIKKAYRRKALELHPDRNYGDVENATKLFAEIQTAHEVLSDPQERAWYDSHRDAILNHESAQEYASGQNVQVTSATKIVRLMGKFNSSTPFTDAPNGFYGSLRHIFRVLAEEEVAAREWDGMEAGLTYPDFGTSDDAARFEEVVRPFYAAWVGFATAKSFRWKEVHRLKEAPDRYVRRLMEKENRAARERAVREFNDTVRSLVLFARKRDPRYRVDQRTDEERQKELREASAAQARRARRANAKKLAAAVVPEWSRTQGEEDDNDEGGIWSEREQKAEEEGEGEEAEEEEEEEEREGIILKCDLCNKSFKSEQQWEAHEKSKKHTKMVQQVKRQMQKENKKLGLDENLGGSGWSTPAVADEVDQGVQVDEGDEVEGSERVVEGDQEDGGDQEERESGDGEVFKTEETHHDPAHDKSSHNADRTSSRASSEPSPKDQVGAAQEDHAPTTGSTTPNHQPPSPSSPPSSSDEDEDEDYAPRTTIADRLTSCSSYPLASSSLTSFTSGASNSTTPNPPPIGKAKAKRAKKLAKATAAEVESEGFVCGVCGGGFASRTKLFAHVREVGHAVGVGGGGGKEDADGKKGKRGKRK